MTTVEAVTDDNRRIARSRWIVLAVIAVVAALVIVLATRPAAETEKASPIVGQPAPVVAGTALDGRSVDLASMRGRWVVVNFFATWCLPCRQEHPELVAFSERHTADNAPAIIAVAFDENDIPATRSFFAAEGGTWPVVPDDNGRISIAFGVRALPESFIVDPEGRVSARISGTVTAAELDRLTRQI